MTLPAHLIVLGQKAKEAGFSGSKSFMCFLRWETYLPPEATFRGLTPEDAEHILRHMPEISESWQIARELGATK